MPVSFPGHAPALIRRRVPVRTVALVDGVLIGEPEPGSMAALQAPAIPGRFALPLVVRE